MSQHNVSTVGVMLYQCTNCKRVAVQTGSRELHSAACPSCAMLNGLTPVIIIMHAAPDATPAVDVSGSAAPESEVVN